MFAKKPAPGSDRNDLSHRGRRRHLSFEMLEDRCFLDVQGLSTAVDHLLVASSHNPLDAEVQEIISEPSETSLSSFREADEIELIDLVHALEVSSETPLTLVYYGWSADSTAVVTVQFSTLDGTLTTSSVEYVLGSGTLTFGSEIDVQAFSAERLSAGQPVSADAFLLQISRSGNAAFQDVLYVAFIFADDGQVSNSLSGGEFDVFGSTAIDFFEIAASHTMPADVFAVIVCAVGSPKDCGVLGRNPSSRNPSVSLHTDFPGNMATTTAASATKLALPLEFKEMDVGMVGDSSNDSRRYRIAGPPDVESLVDTMPLRHPLQVSESLTVEPDLTASTNGNSEMQSFVGRGLSPPVGLFKQFWLKAVSPRRLPLTGRPLTLPGADSQAVPTTDGSPTRASDRTAGTGNQQ